jgi:hypothetical protein
MERMIKIAPMQRIVLMMKKATRKRSRTREKKMMKVMKKRIE